MAIDISHLNKRYGDKTVVDDVSLSIPKGKVTSFIGPNGAGKSTVLGMMSRLLSADSGKILLDGADISHIHSREIARKLAILKQSNHVGLRLTVEDLVAFGRFPYSQGILNAEDKRFIDEAIAYMDLGELRTRYLNELSGGQRQRAFIAMVLAQDTEYILLDEPLNNLDMKHSAQIMRVLHQLCRDKGKTVVVVIHDINFASVYSDHIFAMQQGRLVFSGTSEQLMSSEQLEAIFGFHMPVHQIDEHRLGLYFIA
ncbi:MULTISPECIES: ABC transporter ATP-binding protein [Vitreoscilla]|uniref:ATP-binding cassette domain-containing protein n=1 Tax=Vitreoscilla stercoraria TaxID=61 RepID=A0ABY4E817_VITST|nr:MULTISPECIES: ATP-binding cassette domain-containing protein [Vitreoscilla]AUZ04844.2 ABC transporter ATP-binding protein [Vitreoscilla sp. C1]UOO91491.1 ATP-binding cassette domain-containing protein [Vitreoscilla stercoraria]